MNSGKQFKLIDNLEFKLSIIYNIALIEFTPINNNDPIQKLFFQFIEIKQITEIYLPEYLHFLYFNIEGINKILYDLDEVIYIPSIKNKIINLYYYFYLNLLNILYN